MTTTTLPEQIYAIDPVHSSAEFVVRHLMIAKVRGRFATLAGSISIAPGSHVPTAVSATLETASITTGDPQRDGHLASPDFFDAGTYPQVRFASTRIDGDGDAFELHGHLTMRDKTLPVVLKATYEGESADLWGNRRIGFEAHGKISRKEFGLTWNQALETGGVAIGDDVKIELSVEGIAQQA